MFPEYTWYFPGMITIRPEIATCIFWFTQQSIDSRRLEMGSVVINGKEREGVGSSQIATTHEIGEYNQNEASML